MLCVAPPPDVDFTNDRYVNPEPVVLLERASVVLETDLAVDAIAPTAFGGFDESPNHVLGAGTVVASYLIHFDPPNELEDTPFEGTVHFDREILAIMVTDTTLDESDASLGLPPPALYQGDVGSRSGDSMDDDVVTWAGTDVQVLFDTGGFKDQVRVLTEPLDDADAGVPDVGVADASPDTGATGVDTGGSGATFRGTGGCACETAGRPLSSGHFAALIAIFALAHMWRRRALW